MPRAMVLCAGYGTRLLPLTDELPKPLLPLGDRSFLEQALLLFCQAGFGREVVINVHHLADAFERAVRDLAVTVRIVHEPSIRGTAGGIAGARSHFGPGPISVMIGDVVLGGVPESLMATAARSGRLVLAAAPRPTGSGTLGIGRRGEVVRLRGERFGEEIRGGDYVGLAALGESALDSLPPEGCLFGDFALPLLRRGGLVETVAFECDHFLPGDDLREYLKANLEWLDRNSRNHFSALDAKIEAGVELDRALVGTGACVSGRGRLERVVVLPGATCRAPLADAIVTPSGRVVSLAPSVPSVPSPRL